MMDLEQFGVRFMEIEECGDYPLVTRLVGVCKAKDFRRGLRTNG